MYWTEIYVKMHHISDHGTPDPRGPYINEPLLKLYKFKLCAQPQRLSNAITWEII